MSGWSAQARAVIAAWSHGSAQDPAAAARRCASQGESRVTGVGSAVAAAPFAVGRRRPAALAPAGARCPNDRRPQRRYAGSIRDARVTSFAPGRSPRAVVSPTATTCAADDADVRAVAADASRGCCAREHPAARRCDDGRVPCGASRRDDAGRAPAGPAHPRDVAARERRGRAVLVVGPGPGRPHVEHACCGGQGARRPPARRRGNGARVSVPDAVLSHR